MRYPQLLRNLLFSPIALSIIAVSLIVSLLVDQHFRTTSGPYQSFYSDYGVTGSDLEVVDYIRRNFSSHDNPSQAIKYLEDRYFKCEIKYDVKLDMNDEVNGVTNDNKREFYAVLCYYKTSILGDYLYVLFYTSNERSKIVYPKFGIHRPEFG
jgi:hypothetical protein